MSASSIGAVQTGSATFDFDIIPTSPHYLDLLRSLEAAGLSENVCDEKYASLTVSEAKALPKSEYIKIPQKSEAWLWLRSQAMGTASSVGKFIPNVGKKYTSSRDVAHHWVEFLEEKRSGKRYPLPPIGNMHAEWGKKHEDVALAHFSLVTGWKMVQVGTIKLTYGEILTIARDLFPPEEHARMCKIVTNHDNYLLISPDGIIEHPKTGEKIGMLEIKCSSAFYHLPCEETGKVIWHHNMDSKMWPEPEDVPYYYLVQMSLQALSGWVQYGMNTDCRMWITRWSPHMFVTHQFKYYHLFRHGIYNAIYYYHMFNKEGKSSLSDSDEQWLLQGCKRHYVELVTNCVETETHDISTWYPEFDLYMATTRHFKWNYLDDASP